MYSLRHKESGVKVLAKKTVSSVYSSSQKRTHHVDSLILLDSSSSLWMLLFADGFICVVTAEQWTHTTGFERQSRPELLQVEKNILLWKQEGHAKHTLGKILKVYVCMYDEEGSVL